MALPSFLFGGNTGETPESLKKKRAIVEALMLGRGAPRNVGEGLVALGDGIAANVLGRRADAAERGGMESATATIAALLAGDDFPAAPSSPGGTSPSAYAPPAPQGPTPASPPVSTMDPLMTEAASPRPPQAAKIPLDFNIAQEGGNMPAYANDRVARAFGDEPQPDMNAVANERVAQAFTGVSDAGAGWTVLDGPNGAVRRDGARNWRNNNPGNIEFGNFARNAGAIGTDGRFAVFPTYEAGREAKAKLLFESPNYRDKTIAQAINRYAPPTENNTNAYTGAVARAVGVDPNTPISALNPQQRIAMLDAMEKVEGFKVGRETPMNGQSAPQAQPVQMAQAAPQTMTDAMPEMAGNAPPVQPQQGGPTIQQLIQAASNPWLPDTQRAMIETMLKQKLQQADPNAALENEYKRVQIDNMRSQINERTNPSARDLFGLNPQYGVDANDNPVLLQVGKNGEAIQTKMPEGVTLSKEPIKLDAGTHFILLDPITRQPVGQVEKNVAGEAAAKAGGTAQGEAASNLPAAEAGFDVAIRTVDELLAHPGLESSVGTIQGRIPDAVAGMMNSDVADFRTRLSQAQGQAFLRAFESLKGGGAITEIEGLKAEQALARLNQAVDEKDFKAALNDFKAAVTAGMNALRKKAGGASPPQAPAPQVRLRFNPNTGDFE